MVRKYKIEYKYKEYPNFPEATELSRERGELKARLRIFSGFLIAFGVIFLVAWYVSIPLLLLAIGLKYYLKKHYDDATDRKVLKLMHEINENKRDRLENKYQCKFIKKTDNYMKGKCLVCFAQSDNLCQCRIKNSVGVRDIYICDSCISQFESYQKNN